MKSGERSLASGAFRVESEELRMEGGVWRVECVEWRMESGWSGWSGECS